MHTPPTFWFIHTVMMVTTHFYKTIFDLQWLGIVETARTVCGKWKILAGFSLSFLVVVLHHHLHGLHHYFSSRI